MKPEHKLYELQQVKADANGNGSFTGYAAVFGNKDSYGDIIVPGAFAKTIPSFLKDGSILSNHDWNAMPIAYPTDVKEDSFGLLVTAVFHNTTEAQTARNVLTERINAGKSVKMSIGYTAVETDFVDGARMLKEINLFEASLVNFPANQYASVVAAKSHGGLRYADELEMVLEAVKNSGERARAIVALKEGRTLSSANVQRLQSIREALKQAGSDLDDLLKSTDKISKDALADIDQLFINTIYNQTL